MHWREQTTAGASRHPSALRPEGPDDLEFGTGLGPFRFALLCAASPFVIGSIWFGFMLLR